MESGVKILLERMKTNPEEFLENGNRWMNIVLNYRDFLSAEDRVTLDDALRPLLMERFNKEVLKTLMNQRSDDEVFEPFGKVSLRSEGSSITYSSVKAK